jgi:hypothetical protein
MRLITLITAGVILALIFAVLILPKTQHPKTLLRCDADITTKIIAKADEADAAVLQTKVNFFLYHTGKGFVRLNGYVRSDGKFYILNRELWYNYADADSDANTDADTHNDDVLTLRFTADLKHAGDAVPSGVWKNFLQSEDDKISYHITIKKAAENIYLISTLPGPVFVCRSY